MIAEEFDWYPIKRLIYFEVVDTPTDITTDDLIGTDHLIRTRDRVGIATIQIEIPYKIIREMTNSDGIIYELVQKDIDKWERVAARINKAVESYNRKLI